MSQGECSSFAFITSSTLGFSTTNRHHVVPDVLNPTWVSGGKYIDKRPAEHRVPDTILMRTWEGASKGQEIAPFFKSLLYKKHMLWIQMSTLLSHCAKPFPLTYGIHVEKSDITTKSVSRRKFRCLNGVSAVTNRRKAGWRAWRRGQMLTRGLSLAGGRPLLHFIVSPLRLVPPIDSI